ncbi:MAG TPA: cytochrome bd-I oxidase subunit CydX [Arenicellales bacterium]|nr:cytochrome bd-I oxidase subunit CydX [Arenicellales bacterium]
MWYFSWVLGLGLACAFGILNAMWFELLEEQQNEGGETDAPGADNKSS